MSSSEIESLWNPLDLAQSETAFRTLLSSIAPTAEPATRVELLSFLARAEALQAKRQQALATLNEAEAILSTAGANFSPATKVRWFLERGRLHVLEKTPSQAHRLLTQAWTLAVDAKEDSLAIDIAQTMAVIEAPKQQRQWIVDAISIAEKSDQPKTKRWLGSLYSTLGWKLFDLRQYDQALEMLRKALANSETHQNTRETFLAKWSIAKVLRAQGKTAEALDAHQSLEAELKMSGMPDGRLYEEIAECLQSLNRSGEAQVYFELAYRELSSDEWVSDNQPLKLKRMKELGKVKGPG